MRTRVIGIVLFQLAWLACALSGAAGSSLLAAAVALPVVAWNVLQTRAPARAAALTAAAVALGPLVDLALVRAGLLGVSPAPRLGIVMPTWWLLLWASFASSLPVGLRFLVGRPLLAAACGALAGPASYWAGARLGAVAFPSGPFPGLIAVAACWTVICPLLAALIPRLEPAANGGAAPGAGAAA